MAEWLSTLDAQTPDPCDAEWPEMISRHRTQYSWHRPLSLRDEQVRALSCSQMCGEAGCRQLSLAKDGTASSAQPRAEEIIS